jgi:hypothetical protein
MNRTMWSSIVRVLVNLALGTGAEEVLHEDA